MNIDIQPTIEQANDLDAQILSTRGIEALYVVRLHSGEDYTTHFDKQSLAGFQPKRTVSEMMNSWEETFRRRHAEATATLKSGDHPTRTFEREIIEQMQGFTRNTGRFETVKSKIDKYERAYYKSVVVDMTNCFGNLEFVKIV